ncbi:MAG: divalent-cation tolerance protein CutA [Cyanobacteria bacterium]|nr:divalent-cation tolerance protein CutA [Cyanobacteriota bacterium]MDA0865846.1 divalent-cation tolerance protein CutA [Cyanobacteriota bacterium]
MDMSACGVVLVTIDSQETAIALANALVNEGLAACINLFPIQSIYRWQGQAQQDNEWQLVIKTSLRRYAELAARVEALHPYEVPEIVVLPILAGSTAYLGWVTEQTQPR